MRETETVRARQWEGVCGRAQSTYERLTSTNYSLTLLTDKLILKLKLLGELLHELKRERRK